jgi:hypothetical protein
VNRCDARIAADREPARVGAVERGVPDLEKDGVPGRVGNGQAIDDAVSRDRRVALLDAGRVREALQTVPSGRTRYRSFSDWPLVSRPAK